MYYTNEETIKIIAYRNYRERVRNGAPIISSYEQELDDWLKAKEEYIELLPIWRHNNAMPSM